MSAAGGHGGTPRLCEELTVALGGFPRCKHLIGVYRQALKVPNKTPLSILHEYATRLNLEVRHRPHLSLSPSDYIVQACSRGACPPQPHHMRSSALGRALQHAHVWPADPETALVLALIGQGVLGWALPAHAASLHTENAVCRQWLGA